jgi:hypothetical protein
MSFAARGFAFLTIAPLLGALACGSDAPVSARSVARLQILMDGVEVTGRQITRMPIGFPRFTAAVIDASGAPSTAYGPPVLAASNPAGIRAESDGSLVLLAGGTTRIIATARALSPSQDPQVLSDSATLDLMCTLEMRAGLFVVVRDAFTGELAANGSTLRAISGTWRDSLVAPASYSGYYGWGTAWERSGTYTVTVDRNGYLPWRRDDIVVPGDLCHVTSQTLDVRLFPR